MDEDNDNVDPAQEMVNEGAPPASQQTVDYQKMFETMRDQNAQLAQQNAQLAQTVQQVAQRPIAVAPVNTPDPYAAFDDKTAAAIRSVVEAQASSFKQQFAQQEQRFGHMQLESEAATIATLGLDPAIAARAQAIFKGNRSKGIPLTANEAADFAIGEAVRNGTFKGNVPANQQNRGAPNTIIGGGRPPVSKAKPANFSSLSRSEVIKHYESDADFNNTPIQAIWDENDA